MAVLRCDSRPACRVLIALIVSFTSGGCGESASFKAGSGTQAKAGSLPAVSSGTPDEATPTNKSGYAYSLLVANGAKVIKPSIVDALPGIKGQATNLPLTESELEAWRVSVGTRGDEAPDRVAASKLDLTAATGSSAVTANFVKSATGDNGSAYAVVFVDRVPPTGSLLNMGIDAAGAKRTLVWSASDNYGIDPARSQLLCVLNSATAFDARNPDPSVSAVVLAGTTLHAQSSTVVLDAVTIGGQIVPQSQVHCELYLEDLVGNSSVTPMTNPGAARPQLVLATSLTGVTYTNQPTVAVPLTLTYIEGDVTRTISDASNMTNWSEYTRVGTSEPFNANFPVNLGANEGLVQVPLAFAGANATSNSLNVTYVYDKTPPTVGNVVIGLPSGTLVQGSKVMITWTANDLNGVSSQMIYIKRKNDSAFTPLTTQPLDGTVQQYVFTWENQAPSAFEIYVTATDLAGNTGTSPTVKWTPRFFNVSFLTQAVECLYCHLHVTQDLAGINFPPNSAVRSDSGQNFKVDSNIFATNIVPTLIRKAPTIIENYKNSPRIVFPINNQFPTITTANLTPQMDGTISQNGKLIATRVYDGNLFLDGKTDAFTVRGQVLVKGDVIMRGRYSGIGTIYANNIFITDDIKAANGPNFPYPGDETAALAQASSDLAAQKDALGLGALGQIVIGSPKNLFAGDSSMGLIAAPQPFLSDSQFYALGAPPAYIDVPVNGVNSRVFSTLIGDVTKDKRTALEVNRVDACLYAQTQLTWRAYNSVVVNGCVFTPHAAIASSVPHYLFNVSPFQGKDFSSVINPRTGVSIKANTVQYDWRMRLTGSIFGAIDAYFVEP